MKKIVEEGREKEDMMERDDRRKEENTKEGRFDQKR